MANRKKPVWLTIVGEVTDAEQHTDRLELVTEGYLYEENGVTCITYDETEVSGMAGTTTTVKSPQKAHQPSAATLTARPHLPGRRLQ